MMTDDQLLRYSRQIMLPEFDIQGQEKLLAARVLILGAGGLGCPAALYLAAAGVGSLVISDHDEISLSNLQRQIAHTSRNLGANKAISLNERVHSLNADISVMAIPHKLEHEQLAKQIQLADLVLDCTDNFPSRLMINQLCVQHATPLVSGTASGFSGQVTVFTNDGTGPCYQCLYPDIDTEAQTLTCSETGILSPVVGVIGSLQATEAIKVISQVGEPLSGRLCLYDSMNGTFQILTVPGDRKCVVCG